MADKEEEDTRPMKDWILVQNSELRLEVQNDNSVDIQLLFGVAEIFGTEMAKNMRYTISNQAKIAIFTDISCTIRILGSPDIAYVSTDTPMHIYRNTHFALEHLRRTAQQNDTFGPKVMVCGPTDVGKSTLCRLLSNYAVRSGHQPILVDIDVGQSDISIPGSIGKYINCHY
ncbi:PREDICTED: polyribonucleotide 5'-hydroxyl-kinase Clp1-like [Amphimedon queenslandica]|uniref:Uncharacterized protein n=1 Tax=Amphimedon queenslandica TaxID=400682 RepID=A0A1X7T0W3_AMPQE|nr:PREDICTED: polyribonucleotide 5'-hydroxyl-kinase Clp1-like [Amphimedon queenslandica]|eukprot:XP_011408436.2 PREDICTED: polyribonucleotide 5'-hydroxyl-kinase Clp1-like [Amphimedon queenslandica]